MKNLAEENKSLNHALQQLKDLFIESLVEKDQEIAYLRFDLQELQKNSFHTENSYENIKLELRSQALEMEEKDTQHRKILEDLRRELEEEGLRKLVEEIRINEEKEQGFMNQYRQLEEKFRFFELRVLEKEQEIEELLKEKSFFAEENKELSGKIKFYEIKIEDLETRIKNIGLDYKFKESEFHNTINSLKEQISQMDRNFNETSKKILMFESKSQLFLLKNEKKKKKIKEEREKFDEMINNYKEELKRLSRNYEEKEKELLNEQSFLREELKAAREEKSIQFIRRMTKQTSLKEEFDSINSTPEKIDLKDPKNLFERIGGKVVSKNKFIEFNEILERMRRENEDLIDEFEPYFEDLEKIIKSLEQEMEKLKKNNFETNQEIEKKKEELANLLKKLQLDEKKKEEKNGYFDFSLGFIPFLKR